MTTFNLVKEKTTSTPYVLIDAGAGYMKMEGRSFHENVAEFYKDVNEWLDAYLEHDFKTFTFDCVFEYFNSSTTKLLLNMLLKMDDCVTDSKKITVNWITSEGNEIMAECGEDFREEMENLEFNLIINKD